MLGEGFPSSGVLICCLLCHQNRDRSLNKHPPHSPSRLSGRQAPATKPAAFVSISCAQLRTLRKPEQLKAPWNRCFLSCWNAVPGLHRARESNPVHSIDMSSAPPIPSKSTDMLYPSFHPCRATPSCPASWPWGTSRRSARPWRWPSSCPRELHHSKT